MLGPVGLINAALTLFIWLRTLVEAHRALLPPGNTRIEPCHLGRTHIEQAPSGATDAGGSWTPLKGTPTSGRGVGPGGLRQRRGSPERRAALRGALTIMFISVLWVKIEPLLDNTLGWIIPFFSFVKLLALFAFLLIRQQLAEALLRSLIEPALRPYEPTIDAFLRNASTAGEVSRFLLSLPLAHLTRWSRHQYESWLKPWFGAREVPKAEPEAHGLLSGKGLDGEKIVPPPPLRRSRSRAFTPTGGSDAPGSGSSLAPPARSLRHRGSHASLSSSVSDANLASSHAGPSRLPMGGPRKPSSAAANGGRTASGSRVVSAPSRAPSGPTSKAPSTAQLLASLPNAPSSAPGRPDGRVPSPPSIPPPGAPDSNFTPSKPAPSSGGGQGTPSSALRNFAYIPPGTPPTALPYSLLPPGVVGTPMSGSPSLMLPPALHGSRAYEAGAVPPPTGGPTPIPPGGFFAPNSIAQNLATRMARVGGPTAIADRPPLEIGRPVEADAGSPGAGSSPAEKKAKAGIKRKASEGQLGTPSKSKTSNGKARGQGVKDGRSQSASSSAIASPNGARKKSRTAPGTTTAELTAPRMTRSKSSRAGTPLVEASAAEGGEMDEDEDGETEKGAANGALKGAGKRKAEAPAAKGKQSSTAAAKRSKALTTGGTSSTSRKTRATSARLEEDGEELGETQASSAPSSAKGASARGARGRTNLRGGRGVGANGRGRGVAVVARRGA